MAGVSAGKQKARALGARAFVANFAVASLPSADNGSVSWLAIPRHVQIEAWAVPFAIAVEIQKPLARTGPENADLAPARPTPVARDGYITGRAEGANAQIL